MEIKPLVEQLESRELPSSLIHRPHSRRHRTARRHRARHRPRIVISAELPQASQPAVVQIPTINLTPVADPVPVPETVFPANEAVQVASRLVVYPDIIQLPIGKTYQFTAFLVDSKNQPLTNQPDAVWALVEGSGTLSEDGLYRASPYWSGPAIGRVVMGGFTADIHVLPTDQVGPIPNVKYDIRNSNIDFFGTSQNDQIEAILTPDGKSAVFSMTTTDSSGTVWYRKSFVLALDAPLYKVSKITVRGGGGQDSINNSTGIPLVRIS